MSGDQLRHAHAVQPIAAVQSEHSLWTRDVEQVASVMTELGVALVAFSPLGRGFLTGTVDRTSFEPTDFRYRMPRFQGTAFDADEQIASRIQEVAARLGATAGQIALAWIYAQAQRLGIPVVTIPGTKSPKRLEENVGALDLTLDQAAFDTLDPLADNVQGGRH